MFFSPFQNLKDQYSITKVDNGWVVSYPDTAEEEEEANPFIQGSGSPWEKAEQLLGGAINAPKVKTLVFTDKNELMKFLANAL